MGNRKHVTIQKQVEGGEPVEGKVLPQSVPVWERNGWTVVDDESNRDVSDEDQTTVDPAEARAVEAQVAPRQRGQVAQAQPAPVNTNKE